MFETIFGTYLTVAAVLAIADKLLGERNGRAITRALTWPILVAAVITILVAEGDEGGDRS